MAKISIAFDTNDKTLAVTMDGATVDNVSGVYLSKGYCCDPNEDDDEYRCELSLMTKDEEHDYYTMTRIVAAETPDAKNKPDAVVPGFKVAETKNVGTVEAEIAEFFKKSRQPRK